MLIYSWETYFRDKHLLPLCNSIFVYMHRTPGHLLRANLQVSVSIHHYVINHSDVKLHTRIYRFHCNILPDLCALKQHHEPNPAASWEPGWLWQDKEEGEAPFGGDMQEWGVLRMIGWERQWRGRVCMCLCVCREFRWAIDWASCSVTCSGPTTMSS